MKPQAQEFMDSNSFSVMIEDMTRTRNMSHMDAILELCKTKNIEIENISELIDKKLKRILQNEAINLNLLKKSKIRKLPI